MRLEECVVQHQPTQQEHVAVSVDTKVQEEVTDRLDQSIAHLRRVHDHHSVGQLPAQQTLHFFTSQKGTLDEVFMSVEDVRQSLDGLDDATGAGGLLLLLLDLRLVHIDPLDLLFQLLFVELPLAVENVSADDTRNR